MSGLVLLHAICCKYFHNSSNNREATTAKVFCRARLTLASLSLICQLFSSPSSVHHLFNIRVRQNYLMMATDNTAVDRIYCGDMTNLTRPIAPVIRLMIIIIGILLGIHLLLCQIVCCINLH